MPRLALYNPTNPRQFRILTQPDEVTCGPTCLHAVYSYFGETASLQQVISEVKQFPEGGTLAVMLACHALEKGYSATISTWNLYVFDPTWFNEQGHPTVDVADRLKVQMRKKAQDERVREASQAYLQYISLGGQLRLRDLTPELLERYLDGGYPILCGLNATYLYRWSRERWVGKRSYNDDTGGQMTGHFVVLCGVDHSVNRILVADPLGEHPFGRDRTYWVDEGRLTAAILLGIVTYDANLLVISPPGDGVAS